MNASNDRSFIEAFEECTLPFASWTHRAHVRAAYLYAERYGQVQAHQRMGERIRAYNRAHDRPESLTQGYHETITRAFMTLVHAARCLSGPCSNSEAFCDDHPELLEKSVLAKYYSQGHLMSAAGKSVFVEPDRCPLPTLADDGTILLHAVEPAHIAVARTLLMEFADSLDFELCFQSFEDELAGLPGAYAAPRGRLYVLFAGNTAAGCAALRPLGSQAAELKRMWVRPDFRHRGYGRRLAQRIIEDASRIGYGVLRLDTIDTMRTAVKLYRSLGFVETSPYTENPIAGAMFMQRVLDADAS